jgi:hemophore-related protein
MMRLSLTKLAAGFGGIAIALSAGAGVASADPMDAVINTTCTYDQVIRALNATDPANGAKLTSNQMASDILRSFLDAGPEERRAQAAQLQNYPAAAKYVSLVQRAAGICNNY